MRALDTLCAFHAFAIHVHVDTRVRELSPKVYPPKARVCLISPHCGAETYLSEMKHRVLSCEEDPSLPLDRCSIWLAEAAKDV